MPQMGRAAAPGSSDRTAVLDARLAQGMALLQRGQLQAAVAQLLALAEAGKASWPRLPMALGCAALAVYRSGDAPRALALQTRLLELTPADDEARRNFLLLLQRAGAALPDTPAFRTVLARVLEPASVEDHAVAVARALLRDERFRRGMALLAEARPEEAAAAFRGGRLAGIVHAPLFRLLLSHALIPLPEFDALLAAVRRAVLLAGSRHGIGRAERSFVGALAQHMWLGEYVLGEADEERAQLDDLRADCAARLATVAVPDHALQDRLGLLALYDPWFRRPEFAGLLDQPATAWDEAWRPLLLVWRDDRAQQAIRAGIEALTPIAEGVSAQVREQYEAHPFPRWQQRPVAQRRPARAWLQAQAPAVRPGPRFDAPVDVLVAGCGTGLEPISIHQQLLTRSLLAVDLSRASLAYGIQQAAAMGLGSDKGEGIRFMQADILELGGLAQSFDVITASGVLHHLADPLTGWRRLASLLRPGGVMFVGLYSAAARASVRQARALVAERGYQPTAAGMRELRRAVLSGAHPGLDELCGWRDFYNLSMLRDLAFHVQEHQFTVPMIADCLAQLGLRFAGMQGLDAEVMQAYRAAYPDDPDGTSLDNWAGFEARHPRVFAAMYRVIAQRPDGPPAAA